MVSEISRFKSCENEIKAAGNSVNFSLLYYKFPFAENEKFLFYSKDRTNNKPSPEDKKWLLGKQPTKRIDEYKDFFDASFIQKIQSQHYAAINSLGYNLSYSYENEFDWRLIVGLGTASVYEVGMTLHHTYGIPYIPASAIKGVLRNYWVENYFDSNEGLAIQNKEFCDIFGCPNEVSVQDGTTETKPYKSFYNKDNDEGFRKGQITFFDAFPIEVPTISPDIMNNHYPDYYEGAKKPPADWQSPRPIFFLTVKNTKFKFLIGSKSEENNNLVNRTFAMLKEALDFNGIGAKTAVGYGYMSTDEDSAAEGEIIDCEEKPKVKPQFLHKDKLKPKKRGKYEMEGVITKSARSSYYAEIYVYEGNVQKNVKIDRYRGIDPLKKDEVIVVEVEVSKKGDVIQASYKETKQ